MPFGVKYWAGIAAVLPLLGFTKAGADDVRAAYESQAGYALHLLESGRYGEAVDAAQGLVTAHPDAALPFEIRGTAALYVGSLGLARKDFSRAETDEPGPAALYGLALCDLFAHQLGGAREALAEAEGTPGLSDAQKGDVDTARAYALLLGGDAKGALKEAAGGGDDPLRAEVAAMAAYREDRAAGAAALTKFLATPDGVPVVKEQDGVRPLFDPLSPLEPSVIEPALQQMYADRLTGDITAAGQRTGAIQACAGIVDLNPPRLPGRTALLSYSVDGQIAAMVNRPPYTFTWDTARVANGTHTVEFQAVDAYGNALLTQTETVRVSNRGGAASREEDPATAALALRLWNLLKLRPSRKVAEWTLASAARAAGDSVRAGACLENAAALDPDYKDGRRAARALFGPPPQTPAWRVGSAEGREIALTFDDGPGSAGTPALLDALDRAHVPATFFVVGSRAALVPDLLRRMARRGDEVENHSYTHPNMSLVVPSDAEGEILKDSVLIQALTGHQPHFFRPPGGDAGPAVERLAQSYGLSLAYWSVDALHSEDAGSAPGLVRYVLAHARPGAIVLMHDGPDVTTAAIPALVSGLRARGYTLVTLARITSGPVKVGTKAALMPKMKE